jgi:predicted membrane protein
LLLSALVLIIAFGLALRRFGYDAHLPFTVVKYGGSILWGSMVYLLLASMRVTAKHRKIAGTAALIAMCVEFFRLVHMPWLDAFRLTTAGALLLGRVFSLWNILAYAVGIAAALALDAVISMGREVR